MNMRIEKPVAAALVRSARPERRILQAKVAPVARTVAALSFDLDAEDGRNGRLGGEIDGRALPRPVVSTRLPLRRGGHRHVLLVGQGAERLARSACRLTLDGAPVAGTNPDWLQSPLVDAAELIEGLTDEGGRRLLKLTLTTGASLFGSGRTPGYGAAVRRLLRLLATPELSPVSVCALGPAGRVLSYRLPAGRTSVVEALATLTEDRVARIPGVSVQVEAHARGALLHLHAPAAPKEGMLVALGPTPLALGVPSETEARPLAPWLARRPDAVRAWAADLLEAAAPHPITDALLREVRSLDAPPPAVMIRHMSATPAGVLLLAEVSDPRGLLSAVRVERGGVVRDLPIEWDAGAPIGAFLPFDEPRSAATCRLTLVHKSGRAEKVGDSRPDAYDGAIPEGFRNLPTAVAAPALAAARLSLRRPRPPVRVETIGAPPKRPRLSLVVAAGTPDLIRARAAMLGGEPEAARVEVIHHATAAEAAAAWRALEGCRAVFGLAGRLLTLPDGASPAERLRAALDASSGPVLVLGAEALPAEAGWLACWTKALGGRAPLVLGGTLLGPDGSVLDAGGTLRCKGDAARIERPGAGLPAGASSRPAGPADVPAAACVGLSRAAVAAFRASDLTHPSVEVQLFDLSRRLGRRVRTAVQGPFIRFGEGCGPNLPEEAADAHAMAALRRAGGGGA